MPSFFDDSGFTGNALVIGDDIISINEIAGAQNPLL
jgi:hypothetical protein